MLREEISPLKNDDDDKDGDATCYLDGKEPFRTDEKQTIQVIRTPWGRTFVLDLNRLR